MLTLQWKKHTLKFYRPGGTSRGVLHSRDTWFLQIEESGKRGWGECGMLRGLSADDRPDYEEKLNWLSSNINLDTEDLYEQLKEFSSIQFGLEQAILDLQSEQHVLFPSAFSRGEELQPINGLIWMGEPDFMKSQVRKLLDDGFRVLKMKIGAIDFQEELRILKMIRGKFPEEELELRVDANGAFDPTQAVEVLKELAALQVHSIEQPIKAGQRKAMAELCRNTPVPIALDEELIGIYDQDFKREMLQTIKPQYIILKPSFIGGFKGSEEWISLAAEVNAGWWVTSALESNIGLNAIAQWNYTLQNKMPSGLGTGSLYTNNVQSPLYVSNGAIGYDPASDWQHKI